jgi:hypothetical protein
MKNLSNLAKKSNSFLSEVFRLNLLENWLCIFRSKNIGPIGIWPIGIWLAGFWLTNIWLTVMDRRHFADGHLMRGILLMSF